jgi:hypothetical protein
MSAAITVFPVPVIIGAGLDHAAAVGVNDIAAGIGKLNAVGDDGVGGVYSGYPTEKHGDN